MTYTPTHIDAAGWPGPGVPPATRPIDSEPTGTGTGADTIDEVRQGLRSRVRLLSKVAMVATALLLVAATAKGLGYDGPAGTAFWFGLWVLFYALDLGGQYRALRMLDNPPVRAELVGPEKGQPWLLFAADGRAPLRFTGPPPGGSDPDGAGTVQSVAVFARRLSPGQRAMVVGPDLPRVSVGRLGSGAAATNRSGAIAEGWFPDPWCRAPVRWWDGDRWTHRTIPAAVPTPADHGGEASPSDPSSSDSPSARSGRLEGRQWLVGGACCSLLAAIVVATMIGIAVGNRAGVHPPEVAGELALAATTAPLVAAVVRLRRTRYLEWDETGLAVHNFWRDRVIAWEDVTDVDLTVRSGEGTTSFIPTLRLRTGRPCRVYGLCRSSAGRAQVSATTILALRDRFLQPPVRSEAPAGAPVRPVPSDQRRVMQA